MAAMLVVTLVSVTAFAADSVSYVDADEKSETASATKLTGDSDTWSGWVYADVGTLRIGKKITLTADASLILKDGAALIATYGVDADGHTLTVYGQTAGTGTVFFNNDD